MASAPTGPSFTTVLKTGSACTRATALTTATTGAAITTAATRAGANLEEVQGRRGVDEPHAEGSTAARAATTLANVGPGLGDIIGPAGSFQTLPAPAKWVMTANMIIGRLEIMVIFVLLAPRFWRG